MRCLTYESVIPYSHTQELCFCSMVGCAGNYNMCNTCTYTYTWWKRNSFNLSAGYFQTNTSCHILMSEFMFPYAETRHIPIWMCHVLASWCDVRKFEGNWDDFLCNLPAGYFQINASCLIMFMSHFIFPCECVTLLYCGGICKSK